MRFQVRDELSFRATCGSACTLIFHFSVFMNKFYLFSQSLDILNNYLFIPLKKSTCLSLVILSGLKIN